MPIIIALLVTASVLLALIKYTSKPKQVDLRDEWKEQRRQSTEVNMKTNLIIGCLVCALGAYITTGKLLFVALALPGGYFVAKSLNNRKINKRNHILHEQYVQVLSTLMTSMQGGASPYQALEEAVPALPSPSKEVFIDIVHMARTGSNYEDAVNAVCEKTKWKDLSSLGMALSLYSKTGCNLVVVLKHLLTSVYESKADTKYVESITSSTRTTAKMLSFLPFVLMAFSRVASPQFTAPLFNTTGGIITVIAVTVMVITGNMVVNIMLKKVIG